MTTTTTTERDAWLERRRSVLAGTDVAALVKCNPWRTPLHVYLDKKGQLDDDAGRAAKRGQILEPAILAHLEEDLGRKLARPGFVVDSDVPFFGGTFDALDEKDGGTVVEVKTCNHRTRHFWGDPSSRDCAPWAWAQANWYAGLVGAERILIACFDTSEDELLLYQLESDRTAIRGMRQVAEAFWLEHVLLDEPPRPEITDDVTWATVDEVLAQLHKRDNGEAIAADAELIARAEEFARARAEMKAAEERKKSASAKLRFLLGDAAKARWDNGSISWTNNKGKSVVDWEAIARELATPQQLTPLVLKHTGTKAGPRVLRVTVKGLENAEENHG